MADLPCPYVPLDGHDVGRAEAAVEAGYPAVAGVVPRLIEWLQDYNWPVAEVLAPLLAQGGVRVAPEVRRVLASGDPLWAYWVLAKVVAPSADLARHLEPELLRLASGVPEDEEGEAAQEVAQAIVESLASQPYVAPTY